MPLLKEFDFFSVRRLVVIVVQLLRHVQLCDVMDCGRPGSPVLYCLLEFAQIHVHRVGDATQPSHALLSPSSPAPNPPSIRVFSKESTLHMKWPNYRSFSFSISPSNEHPGLISFRMDWLDLLAVEGTLKSLLRARLRMIPERKINYIEKIKRFIIQTGAMQHLTE